MGSGASAANKTPQELADHLDQELSNADEGQMKGLAEALRGKESPKKLATMILNPEAAKDSEEEDEETVAAQIHEEEDLEFQEYLRKKYSQSGQSVASLQSKPYSERAMDWMAKKFGDNTAGFVIYNTTQKCVTYIVSPKKMHLETVVHGGFSGGVTGGAVNAGIRQQCREGPAPDTIQTLDSEGCNMVNFEGDKAYVTLLSEDPMSDDGEYNVHFRDRLIDTRKYKKLIVLEKHLKQGCGKMKLPQV